MIEIGIQIKSVEDSIKMVVDRKTDVEHYYEKQVERKDGVQAFFHALP